MSALEAWVHRTQSTVAMVQSSLFKDPEEFEKRLAGLQQKHSGGRGLRQLDHALFCMGVLRHRLAPPQQEQDPRTAVPAMLEAVWPSTSEDVSLRLELSNLIGSDLARATWELYSLRAWAFSFLLSAHYLDDVEAGNQLGERVQQLLSERTHGEEGPPNYPGHRRHVCLVLPPHPRPPGAPHRCPGVHHRLSPAQPGNRRVPRSPADLT